MSKKPSTRRYACGILLKTAAIAVAVFLCWQYILCPFYVVGNSMYPAVKDGDLCFLYRAGNYYTGNIVAYRTKNGKTRMGRITAIPGQEIDFPEGGGYTVNGWQPSEAIAYQTYADDTAKYPLEIQDGEFFVMNEFRSDMSDSRTIGCIRKEDIIGKVVFLVRRRGI